MFSRTTVLGALFALSAMVNVAMLNFGFDIPVKILSLHLALMSIFVLGGDLARLANFLLLDRPAPASADRSVMPSGRVRMWRSLWKAAFCIYVLATSVQACRGIQRVRANRSPLYGIYNVDEFSANGTVRPPLTTDVGRWRTVIFNAPGSLWIKRMDDSIQTLPADYDAGKGTLTVSGKSKTDPKSVMRCSRPDPEHLVIEGRLADQALIMKLTRVDQSKFKLAKSRVHWILGCCD